MHPKHKKKTNDGQKKGRRAIFFFIKVFSDARYADAFLDGGLYFNRLSYFKGLEDGVDHTRGDPHEGVIEWRQPDQVKLSISYGDELSFEIGKLAGPLQVQATGLNDAHIFCVYAAQSDHLIDVKMDGDQVIGGRLNVPADLARFGEHVVLVHADPFIKRVASAIKARNHWGTAGLVDYYDPDTFNGEFTTKEALLRKRKEFAYQSEYRFAFHSGTSGTDAWTLDVGSLRDIAWRLTGEDLRLGVALNLVQNKTP
jgi:hypothetical protein